MSHSNFKHKQTTQTPCLRCYNKMLRNKETDNEKNSTSEIYSTEIRFIQTLLRTIRQNHVFLVNFECFVNYNTGSIITYWNAHTIFVGFFLYIGWSQRICDVVIENGVFSLLSFICFRLNFIRSKCVIWYFLGVTYVLQSSSSSS